MEALWICIGMFIGSMLSGWIFYGIYIRERKELRKAMIAITGYEHLKKLISNGYDSDKE